MASSPSERRFLTLFGSQPSNFAAMHKTGLAGKVCPPWGAAHERRELIILLGGSAVVWPLAARAQQSAMPVVGLLSSFSSNERNTAAFNQGLKELGFVDGQNVAIDSANLGGQCDTRSSCRVSDARYRSVLAETRQQVASSSTEPTR